MLLEQPGQESLCFGNFRAFRLARGRLPGARAQRIDGGPDRALHRLPVLHRRAHVAQHAHQAVMQRLHPVGFGEPIDFDVDIRLVARGAALPVVGIGLRDRARRVARECRRTPHTAAGRHGRARAGRIALHATDRVESRMQREPLPVDFHGHGIDQERHVVVDDFHHGVAAVPAVLLQARVVDPHARLAGRELLAELPVRHRGAVEIGDAARDDVLGVGQLVVLPHERLEQRSDIGRTSARQGHHVRHRLEDFVFVLGRHALPPEKGRPHATPRADGWQWELPGRRPALAG